MGCFHSKRQKTTLMNGQRKTIPKTSKKYLASPGSEQQENFQENPEESKPHFTDRQKELVLSCWKCVEQDITRVGVIMFMKEIGDLRTEEALGPLSITVTRYMSTNRIYNVHQINSLFETHPDVQDVFMPFKGKSKEDLKQSPQLQSHALRVMGTVEKCLARMNDPKKLEEMLYELGSRHVMYSAKVDYIDLVGPQFIRAIQPSVADQWTPELEEAWSDLFKLISYIMKGSMTF